MKHETSSRGNARRLLRRALNDSADYQTYREVVARHAAEGTTSGHGTSEA